MYSPRSRWRRSARALAASRWASRSLRQAMYCGEPGAIVPAARQNVSSSWVRVEGAADSARSKQPASNGDAMAIKIIRRATKLERIVPDPLFLLPGVTRQSTEKMAAPFLNTRAWMAERAHFRTPGWRLGMDDDRDCSRPSL